MVSCFSGRLKVRDSQAWLATGQTPVGPPPPCLPLWLCRAGLWLSCQEGATLSSRKGQLLLGWLGGWAACCGDPGILPSISAGTLGTSAGWWGGGCASRRQAKRVGWGGDRGGRCCSLTLRGTAEMPPGTALSHGHPHMATSALTLPPR